MTRTTSLSHELFFERCFSYQETDENNSLSSQLQVVRVKERSRLWVLSNVLSYWNGIFFNVVFYINNVYLNSK